MINLNLMPTLWNIVLFETQQYAQRCKDEPPSQLELLKQKKLRQLVLLGGGMGAGLLVTAILGSVSLLGCAITFRQISILRQQICIIEEEIRGQFVDKMRRAYEERERFLAQLFAAQYFVMERRCLSVMKRQKRCVLLARRGALFGD